VTAEPDDTPVASSLDDATGAGHPRVDAAMSELRRVAQLPPTEQVEGYTHVQRELTETLASIDDGR
jgi:hypothetical protein